MPASWPLPSPWPDDLERMARARDEVHVVRCQRAGGFGFWRDRDDLGHPIPNRWVQPFGIERART